MPLNRQRGNMYPWVTHTWNVIKGKCPHACEYCYMKKYPQPELHFEEKELKTDLGRDNFIFVGSSCDMWAEEVPLNWIIKILQHCKNYHNEYLFQSKNPRRFMSIHTFPLETILGVTIESNRCWNGSKAPCPPIRYMDFKDLAIPKMVSIEPIMDFDLDNLVYMIKKIKPEFVSIGADSQGHNLPEPPTSKVKTLIEELQKITDVKIKKNLNRILRQEMP